MKETRIASRYAKSLFELSLEMKLIDDVFNDMKLIGDTFSSNKELKRFLCSPIIRNDKKKSVLLEIFKDKISLISEKFVQIIVRKGRINIMDHISFEFIKLYKEFKGIKTAYVKSAVPLNDISRSELLKKLASFTSCEVELIEEVDANLIGGFIITVDDIQYDATIMSKLKKMKKDFKDNIYVKGF